MLCHAVTLRVAFCPSDELRLDPGSRVEGKAPECGQRKTGGEQTGTDWDDMQRRELIPFRERIQLGQLFQHNGQVVIPDEGFGLAGGSDVYRRHSS